MGAIDNAKEVAKLIKDLGNMDLYRKILDLQGEIMELTQANRELHVKIQLLENTVSKIDEMTFRFPFYYIDGDPVPYCPGCFEVDKRAVHFPPPHNTNAGPMYDCLECKVRIVHPRRSLNS